jgi:hypothetical protein
MPRAKSAGRIKKNAILRLAQRLTFFDILMVLIGMFYKTYPRPDSFWSQQKELAIDRIIACFILSILFILSKKCLSSYNILIEVKDFVTMETKMDATLKVEPI